MLKTQDYMMIFHEVKNSITLINSSLQLVSKRHPEITDYEYWNEAFQELSYLRNLVIELSQARDDQPLHIHPTNIYQVIHEIEESIRSLYQDTAFSCKVTLQENLPLIPLDTMRIKQAIINLLKNSYEAMNQTGTVLLNVFLKQSFLQIDIIDFGGGINDEVKDHIFDPFVTSKVNGTGLGLSISSEIAAKHHGQLRYESRPGDGCTFSLLLPLSATQI